MMVNETTDGMPADGADPTRGERATPSGRAGEAPRPLGILVVEDEPLIRKVLGDGLCKRGFEVWVAADGAEAVELYRTFWPRIDVVLSDVHMPGLDGPHTLDALREINPSVRCCFMTGDARPTARSELLSCGALRVFTKPFPSVAEVATELRVLNSDRA